jgi:hypothetical protein
MADTDLIERPDLTEINCDKGGLEIASYKGRESSG